MGEIDIAPGADSYPATARRACVAGMSDPLAPCRAESAAALPAATEQTRRGG